jgi:hypothetical protein
MYEATERLLMKLKISIALLAALTAVFAQAKPISSSAHMRPQLFHDRTPKIRTHESRAHETRVRPQKSQPPPAAKEDF